MVSCRFFLYIYFALSAFCSCGRSISLALENRSIKQVKYIRRRPERALAGWLPGCRLLLLRLYGTLILRSLSQDNRLLRCKDKNYESLLNAPAGALALFACSGCSLWPTRQPQLVCPPALSRQADVNLESCISGASHANALKKQIPGSANRSLARYSLSLLARSAIGKQVHPPSLFCCMHKRCNAPTPPKDVAVLIVQKFRNKSRLFSSSRRVSLFGVLLSA
jgi:hypothetical protein